jgi:hypothetical protein
LQTAGRRAPHNRVIDADPMMDEARLIERPSSLARPPPGERVVADPPVEFTFTLGELRARRGFVSLLRRYDLKPHRCRDQRYTTVMVKASKRFVEETLWLCEAAFGRLP